MTTKDHSVIRGRRDLLYDLKGHGDIYGRFEQVYDSKGHRAVRGRHDLLYDPEGHGNLWPRSWPKGLTVDLADDNRCPGNTITR